MYKGFLTRTLMYKGKNNIGMIGGFKGNGQKFDVSRLPCIYTLHTNIKKKKKIIRLSYVFSVQHLTHNLIFYYF